VFTGIHNRADESIEAIEIQYPVLITQKSLRDASGGKGNSPGGMGVSLGIQFKSAAHLIRLHDPHPRRAHGAMGGSSAAPIEVEVTRSAQPSQKTEWEGSILNMNAGDTIFVNSGGGGGFGKEKGAE
jgi:N-methylhydantoinase B/oxoprolinase/acetone carboxylase alpha subunit